MEKNNLTNIKLYNLYNIHPILKLFYLIIYPKKYLFTQYPSNHLDKYILNYKKKIS